MSPKELCENSVFYWKVLTIWSKGFISITECRNLCDESIFNINTNQNHSKSKLRRAYFLRDPLVCSKPEFEELKNGYYANFGLGTKKTCNLFSTLMYTIKK